MATETAKKPEEVRFLAYQTIYLKEDAARQVVIDKKQQEAVNQQQQIKQAGVNPEAAFRKNASKQLTPNQVRQKDE